MQSKKQSQRLASAYVSESVLISILYMIRLVSWPISQNKKRRGIPYVYSPTVILRCFVVRIWLRLDSNRSLRDYLAMDYPYNRKLLRVYGLTSIPDRRTFDRRLSTISIDIKERISTMGNVFVKERLFDPYIVTIDRSSVAQIIYNQRNSTSFRY